MEILYKTKKLEKICKNEKIALKELGKKMAEKFINRYSLLDNANNLEDIPISYPTFLHPLHQNREGQFSVRIFDQHDIVLIPLEKISYKGREIILSEITKIKILSVAKDYHPNGRQ